MHKGLGEEKVVFVTKARYISTGTWLRITHAKLHKKHIGGYVGESMVLVLCKHWNNNKILFIIIIQY